MANVTYIPDTSLKLVPHSSRRIFFWIILVIAAITLAGNVFAIISITKRKQKCLQKVCIISLALADIFSVVVFATNNLDTLSRELKTWELGEFLCSFIPMGQVLGTTASSFALLVIALDRYQNVSVLLISKKWNPSIWTSTLIIIISWIICTATAYPMFMFFTYNPIQIIYTNGTEPLFEDSFMCVAIEKNSLMLYYIIMALFIFLPIVLIFVWFYYQIAVIIWKHRKPFTVKFNKKIEVNSRDGTDSKKTEFDSTTEDGSKVKSMVKKTKTVQMEKKLRTFKVVIVLMMAFILCRLPYWLYFVIKLVKTISGSTMWNIHFALTSLNILNCAMNPFLYTFLNQTISATKKINQFTCKLILCCCCFSSSEFEDFEKNNPFEMNYEQKNEVVDNQKNINVKNTRVKFMDVAHLPMYADGQVPNKPSQ